GPEAATLHILPTIWFRNTWSWQADLGKPSLEEKSSSDGHSLVEAMHSDLGPMELLADREVPFLFTENETNIERIFQQPNREPYLKDGINNFVVHGRKDAVNPARKGTKCSAHYEINIEAGQVETIRMRLCPS